MKKKESKAKIQAQVTEKTKKELAYLMQMSVQLKHNKNRGLGLNWAVAWSKDFLKRYNEEIKEMEEK